MRFVFKFESEPALNHFRYCLKDRLSESDCFVTIKTTSAKVPTLIVNTSRDDSMFSVNPYENTTILTEAAALHDGIVSMHMTHSKKRKP